MWSSKHKTQIDQIEMWTYIDRCRNTNNIYFPKQHKVERGNIISNKSWKFTLQLFAVWAKLKQNPSLFLQIIVSWIKLVRHFKECLYQINKTWEALATFLPNKSFHHMWTSNDTGRAWTTLQVFWESPFGYIR